MYRIRIPIGILLLSLVGGICYLDYSQNTPYFSKTILALVALAALWEFYRLIGKRSPQPYGYFGILCAAVGFALLVLYPPAKPGSHELWHHVWLGAMLTGLLLRMLCDSHEEHVLEKAAGTTLGWCYIYLLFGYLILLRDLGQNPELHINRDGVIYLVFVVLVLKGTDIGGYLLGKLIGRHKLCPHISPKKSWEGLAGGILVSLAMAFGVRYCSPVLQQQMSVAFVVAFSLVMSILSLCGDLIKSIVKRRCQVKDSSRLIPEFGGILDLVDSLILAAPVAYYWLLFGLKLS
jgi:phosphatidate cytidylyltransferase